MTLLSAMQLQPYLRAFLYSLTIVVVSSILFGFIHCFMVLFIFCKFGCWVSESMSGEKCLKSFVKFTVMLIFFIKFE